MRSFRVLIIGFGIQGRKRQSFLKNNFVAIVDPVAEEATYKSIYEVPLDSFDAALLCIPDQEKFSIVSYLLSNKKHVLVEKPLIFTNEQVESIKLLSAQAVCYTAYNHRFEPHFIRMRNHIQSGVLGKIYSCRMFYGNGTARDVRNSNWRDEGLGVIHDLGSHLLDTFLFWFNDPGYFFEQITTKNFENKAPDYAVFHSQNSAMFVQLEMTMLSWRNHFTCDILAENGSAHIESLCKWGPSIFTKRNRKLPSGRPDEKVITLVQSDPTWALELEYFKALCATGYGTNIDNDVWVAENLK